MRDVAGLTDLIEPALGEQRQSQNGDGINGESAKGAIHVLVDAT